MLLYASFTLALRYSEKLALSQFARVGIITDAYAKNQSLLQHGF